MHTIISRPKFPRVRHSSRTSPAIAQEAARTTANLPSSNLARDEHRQQGLHDFPREPVLVGRSLPPTSNPRTQISIATARRTCSARKVVEEKDSHIKMTWMYLLVTAEERGIRSTAILLAWDLTEIPEQ